MRCSEQRLNMAKGSGNPAGKRPSSRNTQPYDANNVSNLTTARDHRGMSVPTMGRALFTRDSGPKIARRLNQHRAPTSRHKMSRIPTLSPRQTPSARYPQCHGYVSVPDDDNLNPTLPCSETNVSCITHAVTLKRNLVRRRCIKYVKLLCLTFSL